MIQPIVLAAGFGTRMGGNKALLPIGDVPALTVVLSMIEAAGLSSPIIVLGHNAEAVKAAVDLEQARVVI
ncbi:NTP transferase domain-containing protein, partial [Candidatus Bipolaricaulota bacterium]|nr:NTP transferase domain-containing protein [Candidatus Bipolaricaulota bacterium]